MPITTTSTAVYTIYCPLGDRSEDRMVERFAARFNLRLFTSLVQSRDERVLKVEIIATADNPVNADAITQLFTRLKNQCGRAILITPTETKENT